MQTIYTEKAPEPIGPYSQAIETGNIIYTSMQIGIDPDNPARVYSSIEEETEQLLSNLFSVVRAGGADINSIVKVTLYIKDLSMFEAVNKVYSKMFGEHMPARSIVNVLNIPKAFNLGIDCIAVKSK
jgi:2-iminobutanoate/2-iminopropanoate deaminase